MIYRLPCEILAYIFRIVASQKVDRKGFRQYRTGHRLVPTLIPLSEVCREWHIIISGSATRYTRAHMLRFEEQHELVVRLQDTRDLTQKYPFCPVLIYVDLRDDIVQAPVLGALLISLLDTNDIADRLEAIEIVCYDTLVRESIATAFRDRTTSNLQYVGLYVWDHEWDGVKLDDIAFESAKVLSGSMFPRDTEDGEPWELVYSELKDLTGIRILDCSVQPDWTEICEILKLNPDVQSLAIQVEHLTYPRRFVLDKMEEVTGITLSSLSKCSLAGDAPYIWQFLSIEMPKLEILSLGFKNLLRYKSISSPVLKADLSRLVYLSLTPLCAATANFLALARMDGLVTLNFTPYEVRNIMAFEHPEDKWPQYISLPALTTLRVAGADATYVKLLLQALAKGSGWSAPLRSLTLDVTLWETDFDSEALQDVFWEGLFCNVTTLSIEQSKTVVAQRFLWKVLELIPHVTHLYLSQTWCRNWKPVLPLRPNSKRPGLDIFGQLELLEINSCQEQFGRKSNDEYLSSLDEAELLQSLQVRCDQSQEDEVDLDILHLRIHPRLRAETKAKIEKMKCSVEDEVDFSYRLSAAEEFDEL